jgi:hypothetical protein
MMSGEAIAQSAMYVASSSAWISASRSTQMTMKVAGMPNMPRANFLTSSFSDSEVTTTNHHRCRLPPDGAHLAACRSFSNASLPTCSSVNRLVLLLVSTVRE